MSKTSRSHDAPQHLMCVHRLFSKYTNTPETHALTTPAIVKSHVPLRSIKSGEYTVAI